MAKFCKKCGARLEETDGRCPNCDKELFINNTEPVKRTPVNVPTAQKNIPAKKKSPPKTKAKQKRKRPLIKFVAVFLSVLTLFGGCTFALFYQGILESDFAEKIFDSFLVDNETESVDRKVPETNESGFVFYQSSAKNIVTDIKSGISYVNNELLVTLKSVDYVNNLKAFLSDLDAKIVGEITELAEYQILLNRAYTYKELTELQAKMQNFFWVNSASLNYTFEITTDYTPNDKNWKRKWGSVPDGTNWGLEAISATGAWDERDNMEAVNIGVMDCMFDMYHEDLSFAESPLGMAIINSEIEKGEREWNSHGTHTSGTIAASFDNKKGIAGIVPNCNLYGTSIWGLGSVASTSLQAWKVSLYYLIATNNCKVINISMGNDTLTFNADRGCEAARTAAKSYANELGNFLQILIDSDYEFVICKSAGNQNETGGGYKYFKKDEDDTNTPYDYYKYSDYLKYLNGEDGYEYFERYKDRKEEISARLESGNVSADWDFMALIGNKAVRDRIIIVGAVKNLGSHKEGGFLGIGATTVHDGYEIATFSQCGESVDVLAPGVDIYSTIKNGYDYSTGTSMAAPHVAGVAGMIFAVNPDLNGKQVKEIICKNTTGEYGEEKYGILNAQKAVEAAKNYTETEEETETEENSVYAPVIEQYRTAIKNNFYESLLNGFSDDWDVIGNFVSTMILSHSRYFDNFKVYYALTDINKDGRDELIIGAAEAGGTITKYDIFTNDGTTPIPLFNVGGFGERTFFQLYDNGIIYINGSGGAHYHGYTYYKLPIDSTKVELVENFSLEEYHYYRTDENGNKISSISESEFKEAQSKHKSADLAMNWVEITASDNSSTTGSSTDKFYSFVQNNLSLSKAFPSDATSEAGVFSVLVDDFDKNGSEEMVTFSIVHDDTSKAYVELDLYIIKDNSVVLTDSSDKLFVSGTGYYQTNACGTYVDNTIKLQTASANNGGTHYIERYQAYTVRNNKLVLNYDYLLSELNSYETYTYQENVSGTDYYTKIVFYNNVTDSGFDTKAHNHAGFEDSEFNIDTDNYQTAACFKGNHIFSLVNSNGMLRSGLYGFIHDNTKLKEKIS